jgi:hypothetical protein
MDSVRHRSSIRYPASGINARKMAWPGPWQKQTGGALPSENPVFPDKSAIIARREVISFKVNRNVLK